MQRAVSTAPTDVGEFISDLNAGVVQEKMALIISEVARDVMIHGKVGKVELTISFDRLADGQNQVHVTHGLKYKRPKKRGDIQETDISDTVMTVNDDNTVTMFPRAQADMFTSERVEVERDK